MSRKYSKKSVPQYKLFAFISKHFEGNVSEAARRFGIKQPRLASIINRGILKQKTIDRIVSEARKIDPGQTERRLFIPPKVVKRIVKIKTERVVNNTPVIRPSMGGFMSIGPGAISAAIARIKLG